MKLAQHAAEGGFLSSNQSHHLNTCKSLSLRANKAVGRLLEVLEETGHCVGLSGSIMPTV